MNYLFGKYGVTIPEILMPANGIDLTKWSVIACDQYTSQPDYWQKVKDEAGSSPSTLHLTFPEIYLKDHDADSRIQKINEAMTRYLNEGILEQQTPGFVLVDRSTPHAASRKGLIIAVDLECYDYREGSQTLIRATEGTVLDRIPPRVKIRENAPIELPHIMLLIDDPEKTVIEPLFKRTADYHKLYDFDLMQGGGHIRGWKVEDTESLTQISSALEKLAVSAAGSSSQGDVSEGQGDISSDQRDSSSASVMLFAAGDGNHSLASAKAHWENVKAALINNPAGTQGTASNCLENEGTDAANAVNDTVDTDATASSCIPDHPARYALVEVVNVHDEGLVFEPIHRVLFGIDSTTILESLKSLYEHSTNSQSKMEYTLYDSKSSLEAAIKAAMDVTARTAAMNMAAMKTGMDGTARTAADTSTANAAEAGMKVTAESSAESAFCSSSRHLLPFIMEGTYGLITIHNPSLSLEVGTLQNLLDELVKTNKNIEVDYIHGDSVVTELGSQKNCMGFYLPVMDKHDLFRTVICDGVLPRKTFSMGEAEEKRYYLECRKIK